MSSSLSDDLLENLAAAAAIAFLGLMVAVASFAVDARTRQVEGAVLGALVGKAPAGQPRAVVDPAFRRIWSFELKTGRRYAAVASLGREGKSVELALLFSREGELEAWDLVGPSPPGSHWGKEGFMSSFLGKGGSAAFSALSRNLVDPEEIAAREAGALLLTRLSRAVRQLAEGGGK